MSNDSGVSPERQDRGVRAGSREPSQQAVSAVPASIPDAALTEIARDFREGILGGGPSFMMCAAVSWPLAAYLRSIHGVDCETIESDFGECNHIWIKFADGRALDPTLDQFNRWFPWKNYPDVWLGPVAEYERMLGLSA